MATNKLSVAHNSYTVFEENQVLTKDQLNSVSSYLDNQDRLTRVKLIGVGIVCGLELGMENGQISLSRGAAVTTDGDLLQVPETLRFNRYRSFSDENARYAPFQDRQGKQIPLYELFFSEGQERGSHALTVFDRTERQALKNMVALLYLESYVYDPDICTGTECDNLGREQRNGLKVLLIAKDSLSDRLRDIPRLHSHFYSIEELPTERVPLRPDAIDKYDKLATAYKGVISTAAKRLRTELPKMYTITKAVFGDSLEDADPAESWRAALKERETRAGQANLDIQYIYDHLKDLTDTFNEFRECLFHDNAMCCPPVELFPKHVLLGDLNIPAQRLERDVFILERPEVLSRLDVFRREASIASLDSLQPAERFGLLSRFTRALAVESMEFRHRFYPSPVLGNRQEHFDKARFLYERVKYLLDGFAVPRAGGPIRITPSRTCEAALSDRAIPFYYNTSASEPVCDVWNHDKFLRRDTRNIYSYLADRYSGSAAALDPLRFSIGAYPFFRIEGHIGMAYETAERTLVEMIHEFNLPIKVETLQIEKEAASVKPRPGKLRDFYYLHDLLRADLKANLTDVKLFNTKVKAEIDQAVKENKLPDAVPAGNLSVSFSAVTQRDFADLEKDIDELSEFLDNDIEQIQAQPALRNVYAQKIKKVLPMSINVSKSVKEVYEAPVSTPYESLVNNTHIRWIDWIGDILLTDLNRRKELSVFARYLQGHPGMEHAAGVPAGGTFILVYSSADKKVVADFMLPYLCDEPVYEEAPRPVPPFRPPVEIRPPFIDLIPRPLPGKLFNIRPNPGIRLDLKTVEFDNRFVTINDKLGAFRGEFDNKIQAVDTYLKGEIFLPGQVRSGLFNKVKDTIKDTVIDRVFEEEEVGRDVLLMRRKEELLRSYRDLEKEGTLTAGDKKLLAELEKSGAEDVNRIITRAESAGTDIVAGSDYSVALEVAAGLAGEIKGKAARNAIVKKVDASLSASEGRTVFISGLKTLRNKTVIK